MTGLNNVTAMNDILVESSADGVTYPFRESTEFHLADAGNKSKLHQPERSSGCHHPLHFTCQRCTPR